MSQRGLNALAFAVLVQHILHPVQRLDDAHGGPVGPIEAAGRSELEVDLLAAELDRLQPCIDQDLDACRDGGREAEIVGGRHAIDERTRLVATSNSSDDSTIVGYGGAAGQLVLAWSVVEATVNAAQLAGGGEALEGLIDGGAAAEIGKIAGRPDLIGIRRDPGEQPGTEVGILRQSCHVRNMTHISDIRKRRPKYVTIFGRGPVCLGIPNGAPGPPTGQGSADDC